MNRSTPKIFRQQSGLMQAVKSDLEEVLKATVVMVEKVKSDPPPKGSLHPVEPGQYSITLNTENGHFGLGEKVT
jgi:hypothetical protein